MSQPVSGRLLVVPPTWPAVHTDDHPRPLGTTREARLRNGGRTYARRRINAALDLVSWPPVPGAPPRRAFDQRYPSAVVRRRDACWWSLRLSEPDRVGAGRESQLAGRVVRGSPHRLGDVALLGEQVLAVKSPMALFAHGA